MADNIDILKAYSVYEKSETFRRKSYSDQVNDRSEFFKKYVAPNLKGLDQTTMQQYYTDFVLRPPEMGNPDHDKFSQLNLNGWIAQGLEKVNNPDPAVIAKKKQEWIEKEVHNQLKNVRGYIGISQEQITKLIREQVEKRASKKDFNDYGLKEMESAFQGAGISRGSGFVGELAYNAGGLSMNLAGMPKEVSDKVVGNLKYLQSDDFLKLRDYAEAKVALANKEYSGRLSGAYTTGNIGSFILSSAAISMGPGNLIEKAGKTTVKAMLGKFALNPAINTALVKLTPQIIRASLEAANYTAFDITQALNSGQAPRNKEEFDKFASKYVQTFGEYAIYDYALALGASVGLPMAKAAISATVKGLTGKSFATPFAKELMSAPTAIKQINIFDAASPELKATLSPATQDALQTLSDLHKIGELPSELQRLNPAFEGRMAAFTHQFDNVLEDGTYRLRLKGDPDNYVRTIDSTSGLYQALADHETKLYKNMRDFEKANPSHAVGSADEMFSKYQSSYPTINSVHSLMTDLDTIYDSAYKTIKNADTPSIMKGIDLPLPSARTAILPDEYAVLKNAADQSGYKVLRFDAQLPEGLPGFNYGTAEATLNPSGKYTFLSRNQASLELYQQAQKKFFDLQQAGTIPAHSIEDLAKADLLRMGFDSIDLGNGQTSILLASKIKSLESSLANIPKPKSKVVQFTGKGKKLPDFKAEVVKEYQQTFNVKQLTKNDGLLINTLSAMADSPNAQLMKAITETHLYNKTGKKFNVNLRQTKNTRGFSLITREGNNLDLYLPSATKTIDDKLNFVKTYYNQINKVSQAAGSTKKVIPLGLDTRIINAVRKFDIPVNAAEKLNWLQNITRKLYNTDITTTSTGSININAGGQISTFSNVEEAIEWIGKNAFSPEELQLALTQEGFKVYKSGNSWALASVGGGKKTKAIVGDSLHELATRIGWTPDKLPASLAPKEMLIFAPDSVTVKLTENAMYGDLAKTTKFFNQFADYSKLGAAQSIKIDSTGRIFGMSPRRYIVQSDALSHEFIVSSAKEADEILERINNVALTSSDIEKIAHEKGIIAWTNGSNYFINDGTGSIKFFSNQESMIKALKDTPTPTGAPDIFTTTQMKILDPILSDMGVGPDWAMKQPRLNTTESILGNMMDKTNAYDAVSQLFAPRSSWLHEMSKKINFPTLSDTVQNIENAADAAKLHTLANQKNIDLIFMEKGKVISQKRNQGLFYYLTGSVFDPSSNAWKKASQTDLDEIRRVYGLTDSDITERIPAIRKLLGDSPTTGLFAMTGMDSYRFVTDYLPRMKQFGLMEGFDKYMTQEVKDFINKVPMNNNTDIQKIHSFFEKSRMSELATMALEDDVYKLLTMYNAKVNKQFFLNGPLREASNVYNELFGNASSPLKGKHMIAKKFTEFCEEVSGLHPLNAEPQIKEGIYNFFTRLKIPKDKAAAFAENLVPSLYQASYLAAMGLKPSLVIRNTLQPFLTASFLGNEFLANAAQKLFKEGADDIFEEMFKFGAIFDRTSYLSNFQKGTLKSTFTKASDFAMLGFKNSDVSSRFIVWEAAKDRFDEGMRLLRETPKTADEWVPFFRYTALNTTNEGFALETLKRLQAGQFKEAKLLYAREMVNQTMFRYDNWNMPFGRHWVGKMFGQFGSYSLSYIQQVRQMLRGLNPVKKLAGYKAVKAKLTTKTLNALTSPSASQSLSYLATWIANGYSVQHAFEMFRMRGDSFNPLAPMYFDGGPYYKLGVGLLGAAASFNSNKQLFNENVESVLRQISPYQAKAYGNSLKLGFWNYPNLYPGSAQYRAITKFQKYMNEEDPYAAILSLGSFSVLPGDIYGRMPIPFLRSDDPLLKEIVPPAVKKMLYDEEQGY